jgi:hypothetical protein
MPSKSTIEKARRDARQGKAPTTQAGEFVHEEIEHVRQGKHGARNTRQAIAIGLSKARRAGVKLPPPAPGRASAGTRRKAEQDEAVGQGRRPRRAPSAKRARATKQALKREGQSAASSKELSQQAKRSAASRRSANAASSRRPASAASSRRPASAASSRRPSSAASSRRPGRAAPPKRRRTRTTSRRQRASE